MEVQQLGTTTDYVVIVMYFLAIMLFGSYFGRFTTTTKDFFFGGQRFSWWLIAASCVATVVGSYSFIKYSTAGFTYGLSSSTGYLNDWIVLPFFIFGWLPIIYYSRTGSIPEYFERRFNKNVRLMATIIILLYLIGYVGINLLTLGVALTKILGVPLMPTVIIIAVISGIYLHFGGQTAVIFTDLLQAFILVIAGFLLFGLGIYYLGGFDNFLSGLDLAHRLPQPPFNTHHKFPFIGLFWQDAVANTTAFYFMNQGVMMRFLSLKSVKEGRKAVSFVVICLMPIAMIAIANGGWLGRAMVTNGLLPADTNPKDIFVTVANIVAMPGVFGFIMAALTAALMSTVDTLINAISAIGVNDIYKVYIKPEADDKHYLGIAKLIAIFSAIVGVILVPVFNSFGSIYTAHAMFTASITPPMVTVIILGAFWKNFTPKAAFYTLLAGSGMVLFSLIEPSIIAPVAHGVSDEGGFKYMRALYSLITCGIIAVVVSKFTKPKENIDGLVVDSIHKGMEIFKGGKVNLRESKPIRTLLAKNDGNDLITLGRNQAADLDIDEGDLIYLRDKRWWYGGLKSAQGKLAKITEDDNITISQDLLDYGRLNLGEEVVVEKIL